MTPSRYDWKRLGAVRDAVVTLVGDHYGLYGRVLPRDTDLVLDLGSDEVDRLEFLMTVEEAFQIRIDPNLRASVRTVGELVDLVERAVVAG